MVVLGVVGVLTAGAGALGASMEPAGPSTSSSFAHHVLAQAPVPPGGQPTQVAETLSPGWIRGSMTQPGVQGVVTLARRFLFDDTPSAVMGYVRNHLPAGAHAFSTGDETGMAETLTVQLPVNGPHEYLAVLSYVVGPTDTTQTHSELRVGAETVWVPSRPPAERAPPGGIVTVTGYRHVSAPDGSTGPVTAVAPAASGRRIIELLDALPRAPRSFCMESESMFVISVRPHHGAPPSMVARTSGCANALAVTVKGRRFPMVSQRGCTLLRDVAALLPPTATATIGAARSCKETAGNIVGP